jgi:hypothetical protein
MTTIRPYATMLRATGWEDSAIARATVCGTAVLAVLTIPYVLTGGELARVALLTPLFVAGALWAYRYYGWSATIAGDTVHIRSGVVQRSLLLTDISGVRVLVSRRIGRPVRLVELMDAEGTRLILLDPAGDVARWASTLSVVRRGVRAAAVAAVSAAQPVAPAYRLAPAEPERFEDEAWGERRLGQVRRGLAQEDRSVPRGDGVGAARWP